MRPNGWFFPFLINIAIYSICSLVTIISFLDFYYLMRKSFPKKNTIENLIIFLKILKDFIFLLIFCNFCIWISFIVLGYLLIYPIILIIIEYLKKKYCYSIFFTNFSLFFRYLGRVR